MDWKGSNFHLNPMSKKKKFGAALDNVVFKSTLQETEECINFKNVIVLGCNISPSSFS